MADQMIFKRYEIKYMLSQEQYEAVIHKMSSYMRADIHGRSTNLSLYFDTPDFLLIRRSLDKPLYKEKLRIRSYGLAESDTTVFIELKKKFKGVVYKRRISMTEEDAMNYLLFDDKVLHNQIEAEIDYTKDRYQNLIPRVLLSYDREAYYAIDDHEFRVTFDQNILWRDQDMNLTSYIGGDPLLKPGQVLMEVKAGGAIPLWFVKILTEEKLYKTSFSKYGMAYRTILVKALQEDNIHAYNRIPGDLRFRNYNDNFRSKIYDGSVRVPTDRRVSGGDVLV
ncbi:VTC domain-containing protein [Lachnospiraceae bacterium A10]|nr:VTC domain-containing protein [Lachnospiraceae bacterium A10]